MLGSIPLIGAWAASKWMIPWADQIGGVTQPDYKAMTQGWWAFGAILGSLAGGQIASLLGRRRSYFLISLGSMVLTIAMFQLTAPLRPSFFPIVFAQGFVATLFFGWLPLYLPELFPTHVRATGSGISYNVGRFATAGGVLAAGVLFTALGGSYPSVGSCGGTDLRPGHDGDLVGAGHRPQVTGLVNVAQTTAAHAFHEEALHEALHRFAPGAVAAPGGHGRDRRSRPAWRPTPLSRPCRPS